MKKTIDIEGLIEQTNIDELIEVTEGIQVVDIERLMQVLISRIHIDDLMELSFSGHANE